MKAVSEALESLVALLDIEPIEVNIFRGANPNEERQRIFGGQVAAQSLHTGFGEDPFGDLGFERFPHRSVDACGVELRPRLVVPADGRADAVGALMFRPGGG